MEKMKKRRLVACKLLFEYLPWVEEQFLGDNRPRETLEAAMAYIRGEITEDELLDANWPIYKAHQAALNKAEYLWETARKEFLGEGVLPETDPEKLREADKKGKLAEKPLWPAIRIMEGIEHMTWEDSDTTADFIEVAIESIVMAHAEKGVPKEELPILAKALKEKARKMLEEIT